MQGMHARHAQPKSTTRNAFRVARTFHTSACHIQQRMHSRYVRLPNARNPKSQLSVRTKECAPSRRVHSMPRSARIPGKHAPPRHAQHRSAPIDICVVEHAPGHRGARTEKWTPPNECIPFPRAHAPRAVRPWRCTPKGARSPRGVHPGACMPRQHSPGAVRRPECVHTPDCTHASCALRVPHAPHALRNSASHVEFVVTIPENLLQPPTI